MPLPGWPEEASLAEPMPGTGAVEEVEEKLSDLGRFIAVSGNKWYLFGMVRPGDAQRRRMRGRGMGSGPRKQPAPPAPARHPPECKHPMERPARLLCRPAWCETQSSSLPPSLSPSRPAAFFTPATRRMRTRLGPDFSKSNQICNFVLLYTTLGGLRGGADEAEREEFR